jgi:hypothetical protein
MYRRIFIEDPENVEVLSHFVAFLTIIAAFGGINGCEMLVKRNT